MNTQFFKARKQLVEAAEYALAQIQKFDEEAAQIELKRQEFNEELPKLEEESRKMKVDWELRRKQDAKKLFEDLATALGHAVVSLEDYTALKEEVKSIEVKTATELGKIHQAALNTVNAAHIAEVNNLNVKLEALNEKVKFFENQIEGLKAQRDSAFEAAERIAAAGKSSTIVNTK